LELTHIDKNGKAKMVDVSEKPVTVRIAKAFGRLKMGKEAYEILRKGEGPKGDILNTAKLAAIMGAKKHPNLSPFVIPLCSRTLMFALNLMMKISLSKSKVS
jgi:cyclic pyranopterin phosphate synthase